MKNKKRIVMHTLEQLLNNSSFTFMNGKLVPCRPENFKPKYCSIFKRLWYAWYVVCGKAETFVWTEGQ